jgi:hypothetical protein
MVQSDMDFELGKAVKSFPEDRFFLQIAQASVYCAYVFRLNSSSCFPLGESSDQAIQLVMKGVSNTIPDKHFIKWRVLHMEQIPVKV